MCHRLPMVSSLLTFISSATEDEASTALAVAVAVAVATGIGATIIEIDGEFIRMIIFCKSFSDEIMTTLELANAMQRNNICYHISYLSILGSLK